MAQLIVRNLEDNVRDKLRDRAQTHGRSMEEEIRDILRAAVAAPAPHRKLGSWCWEQFAGNPDLGDEPFLVEEIRGGVPQPPTFDE
jgi:antitoxin FitA